MVLVVALSTALKALYAQIFKQVVVVRSNTKRGRGGGGVGTGETTESAPETVIDLLISRLWYDLGYKSRWAVTSSVQLNTVR